MNIRLATLDDLEDLNHIYEVARAYMAASGNPNQWGTTEPTKEEIKANVEKQWFQVGVDENDKAHFAFVFVGGEDPTYQVIYDGAWLNDDPYLTIHRVASDGTEHGVFKQIVAFAKEQAERQGIHNLRIDTHPENLTMQHCILKEGFKHCGTIHLKNADSRWSYQLVLD